MEGKTMPEVLKAFGGTVRALRKSLNMTQEQLAEACDRHPIYISNLERGTKNPTLDSIIRVATALGVSPGGLLNLALENHEEDVVVVKNKIDSLIKKLSVHRQETEDLTQSLLAVQAIWIKKIAEL